MLLQQNGLKTLLNNRKATFVSLFLALLNKVVIAWLYSDLEGDKALYLLFTKDFLETGLFTEPVQIFENGSSVHIYNAALQSPLYSLLAAPFLWVSQSYLITDLLVAFIGWFIFLAGLFKVAFIILKERWLANLFVLFAGFFLYPHELSSPPKDTLAVGLVLWSVYLLYQFLHPAPRWRNTVLLSIAIVFVCLTKLLYVPVGIALFILPLLFTSRQKKKHLVHYGVLAILIAIGFFAVYIFLLRPVYHLGDQQTVKFISDGTTFNRGFFPENLLQAFPFISSSVVNTNFWGVQIEKATGIFFGKIMQVFRLIDLLVLVVLVIVGWYAWRKLYREKIGFLLVAASLAILSAVTYMSLTSEAFSYKSASGRYTYIAEARTFLVPMLTLQLFLFRFIFCSRKLVWARNFVLLLLIFECMHGAYFTLKQTLNYRAILSEREMASPAKKVCSLFSEQHKEDFSLVTSDNALRRYAAINNIPVYALTNMPIEHTTTKKGSYVIATHLSDSVLLKKLSPENLVPMEVIPPFQLHSYIIK